MIANHLLLCSLPICDYLPLCPLSNFRPFDLGFGPMVSRSANCYVSSRHTGNIVDERLVSVYTVTVSCHVVYPSGLSTLLRIHNDRTVPYVCL